MAQDYAKRHNGGGGGRSKPAKKSELPSWVWFISGFAAGFFVCFLTYLLKVAPALKDPAQNLVKHAEENAPRVPVEDRSGDEKQPRFEFYNLLPKIEIDLGDDAKPKVVDRAESKQKANYILQCGSFRRMEDAQTRRTELLLMDLTADIQVVELKSGEKTHRVIAGPYDNLNALYRAQDLLSMNGIDSLTIKVN